MIELRALGELDVRTSDDPRGPAWTRPEDAALLAYLVLDQPGVFHHRSDLATVFWPGLDGDAAGRAVDRSLAALRDALPDDVITTLDDGHVGVVLRKVSCDVYEFEDAVVAGRWQEAVDLYRGDLLDGLHVPEAETFQTWLAAERERLRELADRARKQLS